PVAQALEQADGLLEAGDHASAAGIYGQIIEHEPGNAGATAGMLRCLMELGDSNEARTMADGLSDELKGDASVTAVISALELAEKTASAGDVDQLRRTVEADETDHQARMSLALALFAMDQREAAIDELIEIIRRDREWNEQAARTQLLQFFDVMGPTDEVMIAGRRKFSSLMFS
ncbi:MAG: tetratricopeptide repeat protein, partial [Rhodospirillales bacterium]|nr:tetratricopeptide repeat protein [Rhodospirillales bacterium]